MSKEIGFMMSSPELTSTVIIASYGRDAAAGHKPIRLALFNSGVGTYTSLP